MKILIHRYNSICEPDYIDAFKKVGLEVLEDRTEMSQKSIPVTERISKLGEMILKEKPLFVFSINFFPYIALVCEKLQCLYVCVSVDCPVVELFSTAIKSKYNRVFLFDYAQYLDVHDLNPDAVFHMPLGVNVSRIDETIGEPDWLNVIKNDGTKNDAIKNHSDGQWKTIQYKYDVSFVGSLYNEKDSYADIYDRLPDRIKGYCDGLVKAQSLINGQEIIEEGITPDIIAAFKDADKGFYPADMSIINTDSFVAANNYLSFHLTSLDRIEALKRFGSLNGCKMHLFTRSDTKVLKNKNTDNEEANLVIHGGVSSLTQMPQVFRESKINLNMTMRAIRTGLPQRIWDVLGSGGFLLTNYQAELPEFLEIGKHCAAYENTDEACKLIKYYLIHDEEREEITRNGYEFAKRQNTVVSRVSEMIKTVLNTLESGK